MAIGIVPTSEGSADYNGRITWFVVLSSIVAATGGIIFGYDIGISGMFPQRYFLELVVGLLLTFTHVFYRRSDLNGAVSEEILPRSVH